MEKEALTVKVEGAEVIRNNENQTKTDKPSNSAHGTNSPVKQRKIKRTKHDEMKLPALSGIPFETNHHPSLKDTASLYWSTQSDDEKNEKDCNPLVDNLVLFEYDDDIQKKNLKRNLSVQIKEEEKADLSASLPIPDPLEDVAPDVYLSGLLEAQHGVKIKVRPGLELKDYFPTITEEQLSSYTMKVVTVTRQNEVDELRKLYEECGKKSVDCVNRFGESLLHMACRRGFTEMVQFFLSDEVALNPRIRDDFGRTPLHDACWNPTPQVDICKWIMEKDPSLFFVADKHGNTPFQYARVQDWPRWRQFLFDHRCLLKVFVEDSVSAHFT